MHLSLLLMQLIISVNNYSAFIGEQSVVMIMSVCVFLCLSVHEHISGTAHPIFTKFFGMLPMAIVRSSSGSVAMLCISGFMDAVMFTHNGQQ